MDLTAAIRTEFAPLLRAAGFKGSGRAWRRETAEFTHFVTFGKGQRMTEGRYAVDLHAHPAVTLDRLTEPRPRRAADSWFRRRLAPDGASDQWWMADPVTTQGVAEVTDLLGGIAMAWFARFEGFDSAFHDVLAIGPEGWLAATFGTPEARVLYAAAAVRVAQGRAAEARVLIAAALARTQPAATSLRAQIKALAAGMDEE